MYRGVVLPPLNPLASGGAGAGPGPSTVPPGPAVPAVPSGPSVPPGPSFTEPRPTNRTAGPGPSGPSPSGSDTGWKSQMESQMSNFDSKISDLVNVIKSNQQILLHTQNQQQQQQEQYLRLQQEQQLKFDRQQQQLQQFQLQSQLQNRILSQNVPLKRRISSEASSLDEDNDSKRLKYNLPEDFRDLVLTLDEAKELFHFFDTNITPQLFGFEISKFSVDNIWESSPILLCAICAISAMHHPDEALSNKQQTLLTYLHNLCGNLLYQGRPKTEVEGFNTILALIFCSFWLSDSQMFTGVALQIAKEVGLNHPPQKKSKGALSSKDRLKLWYLLYILDGQQSLTYNRQPLVNADEYSLQHSRNLLLDNEKAIENAPAPELITDKSHEDNEKPEQHSNGHFANLRFTDMRLVSQVEYNQALSEAFKGHAWDLLTPSTLGIPSRSNLELDKWMVSWTVLLSPMNNGAVWSSKSTLIYYNFAKMHINSSAVRQLQTESPGSKGDFAKLAQLKLSPKSEVSSSEGVTDAEKDWEDSSDDEDEEFISNKGLISQDETSINANIAFNAAQTVLNLVLNDKDIISNLKYVPVHVHIMLYYACLLLIGETKTSDSVLETHYKTAIHHIAVVANLRKTIGQNFPVDKFFGNRLVSSLDELIDERSRSVKEQLAVSDMEKSVRDKLQNQLTSIEKNDSSAKVEIFDDDSSRGSSPGVIYAWPGSNHGHPSQS